MPNVKPRLFIGSSTEARNVADAIHAGLDHDAEVTVWSQDIFKLSTGTLENLEKLLSDFDFAAFVFSADDKIDSRNEQTFVARDNVIFEAGLFMGKLGRRNVFLVRPHSTTLKMPTDLAGITVAEYDPHRRDGNMSAALGPVCYKIRSAMQAWSPMSAAMQSLSPMSASTLAVNPHYDSDLALLGVNFDLDKLVTPKTIFIITSGTIVSELLDRPTAAFLRDAIEGQTGQRAIIVNDRKWIDDPKIGPNPAISIGSERANEATRRIQTMEGKRSWNVEKRCFGVFVGRLEHPLVALWGYSAGTTREAVELYIDGPRGLKEFLKICATGA